MRSLACEREPGGFEVGRAGVDVALRRLEIRVPREDADRFDADAVPYERAAEGVTELLKRAEGLLPIPPIFGNA